jgi:hypothetical protein
VTRLAKKRRCGDQHQRRILGVRVTDKGYQWRVWAIRVADKGYQWRVLVTRVADKGYQWRVLVTRVADKGLLVTRFYASLICPYHRRKNSDVSFPRHWWLSGRVTDKLFWYSGCGQKLVGWGGAGAVNCAGDWRSTAAAERRKRGGSGRLWLKTGRSSWATMCV